MWHEQSESLMITHQWVEPYRIFIFGVAVNQLPDQKAKEGKGAVQDSMEICCGSIALA